MNGIDGNEALLAWTTLQGPNIGSGECNVENPDTDEYVHDCGRAIDSPHGEQHKLFGQYFLTRLQVFTGWPFCNGSGD